MLSETALCQNEGGAEDCEEDKDSKKGEDGYDRVPRVGWPRSSRFFASSDRFNESFGTRRLKLSTASFLMMQTRMASIIRPPRIHSRIPR
jgi:hypothetical protein